MEMDRLMFVSLTTLPAAPRHSPATKRRGSIKTHPLMDEYAQWVSILLFLSTAGVRDGSCAQYHEEAEINPMGSSNMRPSEFTGLISCVEISPCEVLNLP